MPSVWGYFWYLSKLSTGNPKLPITALVPRCSLSSGRVVWRGPRAWGNHFCGWGACCGAVRSSRWWYRRPGWNHAQDGHHLWNAWYAQPGTCTAAKAAKLLSSQIKWVSSKSVCSHELAKGSWGLGFFQKPKGFKYAPQFEKLVLSCLHCLTNQLR